VTEVTDPAATDGSSASDPAVGSALGAVDVGIQATRAYQRPDLEERLAATRRRLLNPDVQVLVVGEFKKGKSSLINALLNAAVCPVDDDVATAVPTFVRYAEHPTATVVHRPDEDGDARREEVALDDARAWACEAGNPANARDLLAVEIGIPRRMLQSGLVLIDTPGVGGLGSPHTAATIATLPLADAVVFVTDASQELTEPEVAFLRLASERCPNLLAVLSKVDFYHHWEKIRALDVEHLAREGVHAELVPISSMLRARALEREDNELNAESGFPRLAGYLRHGVLGNVERLGARSAANDVLWVVAQLEASFRAEYDALSDPEQAAAGAAALAQAKERAEQLRSAASRWQQTLADGVADLSADLEFDFRARTRGLVQEAEETLGGLDPLRVWDDFQTWFTERVAAEVTAHFTLLGTRARELEARVAENFRSDSSELSAGLTPDWQPTAPDGPDPIALALQRRGGATAGLAAIRGGYSGMAMFGMFGGIIGLSMLNPFTVVVGLLLGGKALKDEKERQRTVRKQQATGAARKYMDEVSFAVGKASRDALRGVQRELRDIFHGEADALLRTATDALAAAQQATRVAIDARQQRLQDVTAELDRLAGLRARAAALAPELGDGSAGAAA
jgi:hypothetical protein